MVTLRCPPNDTGRFVPFTTAPADDDTPTYIASNVTGCVPNVLARRMRKRSPHKSGFTIKPERLVDSALRGIGEREFQVGLRGGIS